MTDNPNKLTRFWQELKRRKVIRVIIVYATTAFILLQLLDIISEPLKLPEWFDAMVIVLLAIGFPIAVIFAWIFDVTPEGIEVTVDSNLKDSKQQTKKTSRKGLINSLIIGVLLVTVGILIFPRLYKGQKSNIFSSEIEKSIAVLPFHNDSNDPSNAYTVNGLMESLLNNLQKIRALKVVSRTSVEKYRNNAQSDQPKLIPEIAKELDVNYIVEGSGQKVGDKIMLTVQLIEANTDTHIWSNEYLEDYGDVLKIRNQVAKDIVSEIQSILTPDEIKRITKAPTNNQTALDYYYRGIDLVNEDISNFENFVTAAEKAISYFEKAIEADGEFSAVYAELAEGYSGFDELYTFLERILNSENEVDSTFIEQKKIFDWLKDRNQDFSALSALYADKALVYDPGSEKGLTTKAHYYWRKGEKELAESYFKKTLEFNPNSSEALKGLRGMYRGYSNLPDAEKYLEYALLAVKIEVEDSVSRGNDFYQLSNAFRWAGFFDEAETYLKKAGSLDERYSTIYIERYHLLCETGQFQKAKELLLSGYDESILVHNWTMALLCHNLGDHSGAVKYYTRQMNMGSIASIDKIRFAYNKEKSGDIEGIEDLMKNGFNGISTLQTIYKYCFLAAYYSFQNEPEEALNNIRRFAQEEGYAYYTIRNFKYDPLYNNIKNLPEFKILLNEIEEKFWANHKQVKTNLTEKGLLPIKM